MNDFLSKADDLIDDWEASRTNVKPAGPSIGVAAPKSKLPLKPRCPAMIVFTRHAGCAFCELEIRQLVRHAAKEGNLQTQCWIVIHSISTQYVEEFVCRELGLHVPSNVHFYGDEDRSVYQAFLLGDLVMEEVVNDDTMAKTQLVIDGGIPHRTFIGSRLQTNGGFAIDARNIVRYSHVAVDSADVTNIRKAFSQLRKASRQYDAGSGTDDSTQ